MKQHPLRALAPLLLATLLTAHLSAQLTYFEGFDDDYALGNPTPDLVDAALSTPFSGINSGVNGRPHIQITGVGIVVDFYNGGGSFVTLKFPAGAGLVVGAGSSVDFDLAGYGDDGGTMTKYVSSDGSNFTQVGDNSAINGPYSFALPAGGTAAWFRLQVGTANGAFDGLWVDNFSATIYQLPAVAVDAGDCQTVYRGYAPAACATLTASASSGTAPYSYLWSNGATTASTTVCPLASTIYSVTASDANGSTATSQVDVKVVDVRCGNNLQKVNICHNGSTLCVAASAVAAHLGHGDALGGCGTADPCGGGENRSLSFTAWKTGGAARLNWLVADGGRFEKFAVLRSCDDGRTWAELFVEKSGGQPGQPAFFEKTDDRPGPGRNGYRIEFFEKDGSVASTETRWLDFPAAGDWGIFPNPASDWPTVFFSEKMAAASGATVTVTDLTGRETGRFLLKNEDLQRPFALRLPSAPSGTYLLTVAAEGARAVTARFFIEKE